MNLFQVSFLRALRRAASAPLPAPRMPSSPLPPPRLSVRLLSSTASGHNASPTHAAVAPESAVESPAYAEGAERNAEGVPAAAALSSCPEGTVLSGLSYIKGRADPVALRDDQYPSWLWDCLDVMKKADSAEDADAGDEFSKSKKQRKMAARRQRDLEAKLLASGDLSALAPKIPLQHQTINLTPATPAAGDSVDSALEAAAKRLELRIALRKERRAKIKESNYLRSM